MARDRLSVGEVIRAGYRLAASDPGVFFLLGFAILAHAATIVLAGPALVGAAVFAGRRMRGEQVELGVFYRGFTRSRSPYFAGLILWGITLLPSGACLTAFVSMRWALGEIWGSIFGLPFIVLMVVYVLACKCLHLYLFHALADNPEDLWGAFERARSMVMSRPVEHVLLVLCLAALNLIGALACGVGLLLTMPISFCAVSVAYRAVAGQGLDEFAGETE